MTKIFEFVEIAKLGSSRGVEGGVKFIGREEAFAFLLESKYVFVKMKDGNPVPYFIEGAEQKGDYILYLEGVKTPQEAKMLTGCDILIEKENFDDRLKEPSDDAGLEYAFLRDYLLRDKTSGFHSRIEKVESYPQQEMAILESSHLVPLHSDFIVMIHEEEQLIEMELPEGLFDE